jgi:hypothetical protein
MNDSTTTEFFKLVKGCVERKLDARHWRWSMADSLLIDWCLMNMEADHARRGH